MSIDQRKFVADIFKYLMYAIIGVCGYLIKEAFEDTRQEVHIMHQELVNVRAQMQQQVGDIKDRINQVDLKVVRLETKFDK